LEGVDLLVFMGTWCEDSQRELPHFYKILDHLGIPESRLRVVALDNHPDRRKTSPDGAEQGWNIDYVPTFIFLKNGKELGRIVETPLASLERDMINILATRQN
jgi:thiol-disulfide isomerase/thioredoxin